jgi:dihydroxyacetone kinase
MKKLINDPRAVVDESVEGFGLAHADLVTVFADPKYIVRKDAPVAGKAGDSDVRRVLLAAAEAAEAGAVSTDPMLARKGRASYLGERSIGHRDPGAVSSALILRAAVGAAE